MPRLYIGNLNRKVDERDIKKFFRDYGRVRSVDLKNGYGFVEMDDRRDAEDAIHDLDGTRLLGERVTVEMARSSARVDGGSRYGRYESRDSRDTYSSRRPIRSEHRIIVEELSTRVSWQDLKDLMRKVGEVTFADAHKIRSNEGVVEFSNRSDMKAAIDKYDGYELYGYKLRVYADRKSGSRRRSKSRSRRRRSSTRSRRRSTSRSRSRSRTRSSGRRRRTRSKKRSTSRKHSVSNKKKRSTSNRRRSRSRRSSVSKKRSVSYKRSNTRSRSKNDLGKSVSPSVDKIATTKVAKKSRTRSRSLPNNVMTNNINNDGERRSKSPTNDATIHGRSGTRSRSKSKSGTNSKSRSKSRSNRKSRSKSRSNCKSHSKSLSNCKSRSKSRSNRKSRSKSRSNCKSRSKSRSNCKSRSKSRSNSKSASKSRSNSKSETKSGSKSDSEMPQDDEDDARSAGSGHDNDDDNKSMKHDDSD